jgi:hypothetical protein
MQTMTTKHRHIQETSHSHEQINADNAEKRARQPSRSFFMNRYHFLRLYKYESLCLDLTISY